MATTKKVKAAYTGQGFITKEDYTKLAFVPYVMDYVEGDIYLQVTGEAADDVTAWMTRVSATEVEDADINMVKYNPILTQEDHYVAMWDAAQKLTAKVLDLEERVAALEAAAG